MCGLSIPGSPGTNCLDWPSPHRWSAQSHKIRPPPPYMPVTSCGSPGNSQFLSTSAINQSFPQPHPLAQKFNGAAHSMQENYLVLLMYYKGYICIYIYTHIHISFFFFLEPHPTAYEGCQARGWTRVVAASLHHSHSNSGSEPCLWRTPQLMATSDL